MNSTFVFVLVTAATIALLGLASLTMQTNDAAAMTTTTPGVYVIAEEDFNENHEKIVRGRVVDRTGRDRERGPPRDGGGRPLARPPPRSDRGGPPSGAPSPRNPPPSGSSKPPPHKKSDVRSAPKSTESLMVPNEPGFFKPVVYNGFDMPRPENVPPTKILHTTKSFSSTSGESIIQKDVGRTCVHPKEQDTAVIFVHVFKTGGTTIRNVLMSYSQSCGLNYFLGGQGIMCDQYESQCGEPCRNPTAIPEPCELQKKWMLGQDVMSGHFFYGTHSFYPKTFYITQLRHPITAFVSARMYVPQKRGNTVQSVKEGIALLRDFFDAGQYRKGGVPYRVDFMMRLTAYEPRAGDDMEEMTQNVLDNLDTFGVVGLTEHWNVTLRLLQHTLDRPDNLHFWDLYEDYVSNSAHQPFSTTELVNAIPEDLMAKIEEYTRYESTIYYYARDIMYKQCMSLLAPEDCECIALKTKHYGGQKKEVKIGERYTYEPSEALQRIGGGGRDRD